MEKFKIAKEAGETEVVSGERIKVYKIGFFIWFDNGYYNITHINTGMCGAFAKEKNEAIKQLRTRLKKHPDFLEKAIIALKRNGHTYPLNN